MLVTFGKHAGKTVEALVLKHADYVNWVLDQGNATGAMAAVRDRMRELIREFDSKPLVMPCKGCGRPATRASLYRGSPSIDHWWCDACNPYTTGAAPGMLQFAATYHEVLHFAATSVGRRQDMKSMISGLAKAKGLPPRSNEAAMASFFA